MSEIILTERQIVKGSDLRFSDLDHLTFLSKNLYNATLYVVRKHYFETGSYLSYVDINKLFIKDNNVDYRALPAKVSGQVQRLVEQNFKSFFALLKKDDYDKPVKIPKYLDKVKGRQVLHYDKQALRLTKDGLVTLSKSHITFKTCLNKKDIRFLRIIPRGNHFIVEIGYRVKTKDSKANGLAFIDPGLNNLLTVTSTEFSPLIYNGRPLKSVNQFYNKITSKVKSDLLKVNNVYASKSLKDISLWRYKKLLDYTHRVTTHLMNHLVKHQVGTLIIGRNKGLKQDIELGRKTNQNFVSIPMGILYQQLEYKCKLLGIQYIEIEESYTSKTSFLDLEPIVKQETYQGSRLNRGLFKSSKGICINADVNGSLNIGRKYLSSRNLYTMDLHEKLVSMMHNPKKVTILYN